MRTEIISFFLPLHSLEHRRQLICKYLVNKRKFSVARFSAERSKMDFSAIAGVRLPVVSRPLASAKGEVPEKSNTSQWFKCPR